MGNRKRLFLHVGLHKTGTTSIQWALTVSRKLLRRMEFLYPDAGVPDWSIYGQHLLPWSLLERDNYLPTVNEHKPTFDEKSRARLWDTLHTEIEQSGNSKVVLSSEEFDVLSQAEISSLGRELERYDVTPILFLRNYSDLLESAFRTYILYAGYSTRIVDFVDNQRTRLDYAQLIRDWRGIASSGEMFVMSYDDAGIRRDAVATFLGLLGLKERELKIRTAPRQNLSESAFICEIARYLRVKGYAEAQITKWVRQIRRIPIPASASRRYVLLPFDLREALNERYTAEVASIMRDPELGKLVRGRLGVEARSEARIEVRGIADALMALGREIGHPE